MSEAPTQNDTEPQASQALPTAAQMRNGLISFATPQEQEEQARRMEEMRKRLAAREEMMKRMRDRSKKRVRNKNTASDAYLEKFQATEKDIIARLEKAVAGETTPDYFEEIRTLHGSMMTNLSEKGQVLPSYLLERCRQRIDELRVAIDDKQKEVAPKKKFRFSKRKKTGGKKKEVTNAAQPIDLSDYMTGNEIQIKDLNLQTIYKPPGSINGSDIVISNLKNCVISICDNVGALRLNNLSHCKIYVGPISSSMLVYGIQHSLVMIATRQCRIHSATETDFYLQVNSNPIIEHSSSVRFGPYSFSYPEIDRQFETSGLDLDTNSWAHVKDFNWHRTQHSPNWTVIPEKDRVTNATPIMEDDDEDEF